MLGYGEVGYKYNLEMIDTLYENGYQTVMIGKNHFGWNTTINQPYKHGYQYLQMYDGLGTGMPHTNYYDNYDQW